MAYVIVLTLHIWLTLPYKKLSVDYMIELAGVLWAYLATYALIW